MKAALYQLSLAYLLSFLLILVQHYTTIHLKNPTLFCCSASIMQILLLKSCQQLCTLHLICWCGRSSILPIDGNPVNNTLFCLDLAGNMTQRQKKVGQNCDWKQSRNTADRTEGCWVFRAIRVFTGLKRDHNTALQSSWINTQKTILTDKHSMGGVGGPGWLAGLWVRGQCWHDSMWVCEIEQHRKWLPC